MNDYKVEAWGWCADYCKKNQWNPHDSYFWGKALLEYRRENNIFEVGDYVIFSILGNEVIQHADWLKSQNQDWIRHATPKEIKAGHRLK